MLHEEPPSWLRVLLVEDDPADVYLVSELLDEVDAPVLLTVASSIAEVLDAGMLQGADCVLLDLNLPGTTGGLDGLRRLLAVDPAVAVCVLTGTDDEYLGAAAVAAGAQDYLVKGAVDGTLLNRAIRYAVERRRAQINLRRLREAELYAAESARLERGLMPGPLLAGSGVSALPFYRAGRRSALLGGDFYDVVEKPDGTLDAIIGDVCGHSVDQAALGALLRVSWRALVLGGVPEPAVLPALQQVLATERAHPSLFTTVCTIQIVDRTASVRLAGHPAPVLLWPRPAPVAAAVGLPLGLADDANWERAEVRLPDRWAIMMYTDGLIEGHGPNPPERLWDTGLLRLLDSEHNTPLTDLPARLVERAEVFNDGPLPDDVAILVLTGEPEVDEDREPAASDQAAGAATGSAVAGGG
ncbi:MAG TPA: SpoIIE family protein phosphatase [Pseudonocardiaceae bacterium]|jgi:serine phosphatase RsbU (regulator of sigma subunit)